MRLCILSDCSGPTNPTYPGHGLGQAVHRIATYLDAIGHDVTLVASEGSAFNGALLTPVISGVGYEGESILAQAAYTAHQDRAFDVFLDCTHTHILSSLFPQLPVANMYHDIYQPVARCPIVVSFAQKALMPEWADTARVVYNTVNPAPFSLGEAQRYAVYMGMVRDYKNPILAIEACAIAGLPLKIAGPFPGDNHLGIGQFTNCEYIGPVSGDAKASLLRGASVLLQLGHAESFGLSTVEAGLCGVPVVALPSGGNMDIIEHGKNGAFVPLSGRRCQAVADAMQVAMSVDRAACREYAMRYTDGLTQAELMSDILTEVAQGERW